MQVLNPSLSRSSPVFVVYVKGRGIAKKEKTVLCGSGVEEKRTEKEKQEKVHNQTNLLATRLQCQVNKQANLP